MEALGRLLALARYYDREQPGHDLRAAILDLVELHPGHGPINLPGPLTLEFVPHPKSTSAGWIKFTSVDRISVTNVSSSHKSLSLGKHIDFSHPLIISQGYDLAVFAQLAPKDSISGCVFIEYVDSLGCSFVSTCAFNFSKAAQQLSSKSASFYPEWYYRIFEVRPAAVLHLYVPNRTVQDIYQTPRLLMETQRNLSRLRTGTPRDIQWLEYITERRLSFAPEHYEVWAKPMLVFQAKIQEQNGVFTTTLPGMVEWNPPLLVGDEIRLMTMDSQKHVLVIARVKGIRRRDETIAFEVENDAKLPFATVKKALGNRSCAIQCFNIGSMSTSQARALEHLSQITPTSMLARVLCPDPSEKHPIKVHALVHNLNKGNAFAGLNVEQWTAIEFINSTQPPTAFLSIFGPPGTGKTGTLVTAVRLLLTTNPNHRVLFCTPSIAAADVVAKRLAKLLKPNTLMLYNSVRRQANEVPAELQNYAYNSLTSALDGIRVVVTTCTAAQEESPIHRMEFTHLFIDEVAQAYELEALIPLSLPCCRGVFVAIAGDHFQLGPIVTSPLARQRGLATSLLERIMDRMELPEVPLGHPAGTSATPKLFQIGEVSILHLTKNYRSTEELLHLPSALFYGNRLEALGSSTDTPHSFCDSDFPVVFFGVKGVDSPGTGDSVSYFNSAEADKIEQLVTSLIESGSCQPRDIGVIAPFREHVTCVRKTLRASGLGGVNVGTIENYQGQEQKVIIVSCVRTEESIDLMLEDKLTGRGLIGNDHSFNVAVSRAKSLLLVVGDPEALVWDRCWEALIQQCVRNGSYTGSPCPESTYYNACRLESSIERMARHQEAFKQVLGDIEFSGAL